MPGPETDRIFVSDRGRAPDRATKKTSKDSMVRTRWGLGPAADAAAVQARSDEAAERGRVVATME
ncbi:hypothetical protein GCM10017083_46620 [Thalassobaculum fulvum]|uniref:Uncharacterized protein n=1 Tax=Thalassobaculum fulvum TaxID=1633335 RepID=A0A918XW45_9PROT|nr:hypothetical protein GCM10017083_46620 [Thalassobaculum fulvum]